MSKIWSDFPHPHTRLSFPSRMVSVTVGKWTSPSEARSKILTKETSIRCQDTVTSKCAKIMLLQRTLFSRDSIHWPPATLQVLAISTTQARHIRDTRVSVFSPQCCLSNTLHLAHNQQLLNSVAARAAHLPSDARSPTSNTNHGPSNHRSTAFNWLVNFIRFEKLWQIPLASALENYIKPAAWRVKSSRIGPSFSAN